MGEEEVKALLANSEIFIKLLSIITINILTAILQSHSIGKTGYSAIRDTYNRVELIMKMKGVWAEKSGLI